MCYETQLSALCSDTVSFLTPALCCLNMLRCVLPQVTLHSSHVPYMPFIPMLSAKIYLLGNPRTPQDKALYRSKKKG